MAQEDPNRFVEWFLLLRGQIPAARQRVAEWLGAVREEPILIWQTPAVRYGTYVVAGLVLMWTAVGIARALAPAPPANARPEATSADFHVICAHPECGEHFVIHRRFGFDDFPVPCPRCQRNAGYEARMCSSATCKRRWRIPVPVDGELHCPVCGEKLP